MAKSEKVAAPKVMQPQIEGGLPRLFEATVEVCGHTVSFWYDLGQQELAYELQAELKEAAERRARELICEDYHSGELNCAYGDEAIRGWWEIEDRKQGQIGEA
jgi:hypothetical protein